MRLKNIKGAKEYVEASNLVILEPQEHKGKWKNLFNNNNDIHIEIGMGRGDFVIGMALLHPEINYIGIEMYDSVIYKAVKKIESLETRPDNLLLIRMDATNIMDVFDKEISRIYLNFSDPWPKAKHEKRRLTSKQFLDRYENIFIGEKQIFQKTDNDALFEFSIESLEQNGYILKNVTRDLYSNMIEGNIATEYETKFASIGKNINRLEAYKN
ncbi:MAG: tRNA (guanosine(46)-N7)-methyltransferase TrmB [Clostridia bacterium]|nr:tRNA (guanosine(46)-N7)-methyltransferase TrmB [Clostridia bacterium]